MDWKTETFRLTVVLVAASVALVGAGVAGVGGSLLLAVVFAGLAGVLFAARDALAAAPVVVGHDVGHYGAVLWVGPLVGTVIVLVALDATPAELQALGGLVGLAGMVNYFLRPVYRLVYSLLGRVGVAA